MASKFSMKRNARLISLSKFTIYDYIGSIIGWMVNLVFSMLRNTSISIPKCAILNPHFTNKRVILIFWCTWQEGWFNKINLILEIQTISKKFQGLLNFQMFFEMSLITELGWLQMLERDQIWVNFGSLRGICIWVCLTSDALHLT